MRGASRRLVIIDGKESHPAAARQHPARARPRPAPGGQSRSEGCQHSCRVDGLAVFQLADGSTFSFARSSERAVIAKGMPFASKELLSDLPRMLAPVRPAQLTSAIGPAAAFQSLTRVPVPKRKARDRWDDGLIDPELLPPSVVGVVEILAIGVDLVLPRGVLN